MTLIRRLAQLKNDLGELGIFPKSGKMDSVFIKNDIFLLITFPTITKEETIDSIINAIENEFKDVNVKHWGSYSKICIKVIISEKEITEKQMTNSYKYFDF